MIRQERSLRNSTSRFEVQQQRCSRLRGRIRQRGTERLIATVEILPVIGQLFVRLSRRSLHRSMAAKSAVEPQHIWLQPARRVAKMGLTPSSEGLYYRTRNSKGTFWSKFNAVLTHRVLGWVGAERECGVFQVPATWSRWGVASVPAFPLGARQHL